MQSVTTLCRLQCDVAEVYGLWSAADPRGRLFFVLKRSVRPRVRALQLYTLCFERKHNSWEISVINLNENLQTLLPREKDNIYFQIYDNSLPICYRQWVRSTVAKSKG